MFLVDIGGPCWIWGVTTGRSDLHRAERCQHKGKDGRQTDTPEDASPPPALVSGRIQENCPCFTGGDVAHKYPPSFLAWTVRLVQDRKLMTEDEGQPVASAVQRRVLNQRKIIRLSVRWMRGCLHGRPSWSSGDSSPSVSSPRGRSEEVN